MNSSAISSSSTAHWLQGLLAKGAPSQTGHPSGLGTSQVSVIDRASISTRAFELNQAAGVSFSSTKDAERVHGLNSHQSDADNTTMASNSLLVRSADRKNDYGVSALGSRLSLIC